MRFFTIALIFCGVAAASAQTPVVPHKINFAGITLTIRDDARREIQKDVDALTQSPKYFTIKAERARTYFPIIEKIFEEERVPDDFKYLSLQESALIADAVSVSDAVGFWQFKDFTAREMGMRVDDVIDERMNIVSSTRGAARYIKQNNFLFNNWVYALQAYQMGAGGVKRMVGDYHDGARHMEITSETYWYVKKFLAHKVAFEDAMKQPAQTKVEVVPVANGGDLKTIAEEESLDIAMVQSLNKWARKGIIPADKPYLVIVPAPESAQQVSPELMVSYVAPKPLVKEEEKTESSEKITGEVAVAAKINDILVIQANSGETLSALAQRAGLEVTQFMKFNEVPIDHKVVAGNYYFLDKKKTTAPEEFHKVKEGENLWQISQLYGLQIKRLKKYNQLQSETVQPGTMVWLTMGKPKEDFVLEEPETVAELETDQVMDWAEVKDDNNPEHAPNDLSMSGFKEHQVQPGETIYSIAKLYEVNHAQLQELNEPELKEGLKAGQIIKISANQEVTTSVSASENSSSERIHEVRSSETLYSVARQYGITIKELMECNAKTEMSVSVGEKLKIPAR